jgi:5-oxopent-3-ene-1,2,5-tricarboxylate decarboxylase/2-hydroxyhepta-2,4-diene-1,7-dioate isomerase
MARSLCGDGTTHRLVNCLFQPVPPMRQGFESRFDFAPWRLSGVVYGTLLNDPAALAALGDAVYAPPYKAPPVAPVLYLKPRNTLAASGSAVVVPADAGELEIGAALGLVIGRSACRVHAADASAFVAGWTLVADLSVPHESLYRPNVRCRARDGSCLVGPRVVPRAALVDPDALEITVAVDGRSVHRTRTAGMLRPVAQLLQDVTEFMTLHPGDILMLGVAAGAPRVGAGHAFTIEAPGVGRLEGRLVAPLQPVPA